MINGKICSVPLNILSSVVTHDDLQHDVNVNISNFAIFGLIFVKFSPKCKAKELGIKFITVEKFCSFS